MIMGTNFDERFENALQSSEPHKTLTEFVTELASSGHTQEEVYQIFDSFRSQLRLAARESDEDIVMDVMDYICGWCSPHSRLFPAN
jgi:hypothetical protein